MKSDLAYVMRNSCEKLPCYVARNPPLSKILNMKPVMKVQQMGKRIFDQIAKGIWDYYNIGRNFVDREGYILDKIHRFFVHRNHDGKNVHSREKYTDINSNRG